MRFANLLSIVALSLIFIYNITKALGDPIPSVYPQISLKTMSKNDAMVHYIDSKRKDGLYDWKVRLEFYGKVVDENNNPLPDATVDLNWNTTTDPNEKVTSGTAYKTIRSDGNGLFSLEGKAGKILGITVRKDGYYSSDVNNFPLNYHGEASFEYADPSSPNWYEPNPSNPEVFRLHKKGLGITLRQNYFYLNISNTVPHQKIKFNLEPGMHIPGFLCVTMDHQKSQSTGIFPWSTGVTLSEGGLVKTDEKFPFMAPQSGYIPSVKIDMPDTAASSFKISVVETFYIYFSQKNIYGRLTYEVDPRGRANMLIVYNPEPGNRYLEPNAPVNYGRVDTVGIPY